MRTLGRALTGAAAEGKTPLPAPLAQARHGVTPARYPCRSMLR